MNTIYVYHLHTHSAKALPTSFYACLRDDDWIHVQAARHPEQQQVRQLAYAATYHLLAHYNNVSTDTLCVQPDHNGKPHALFDRCVAVPHFSISHSHHVISIALSAESVGVDVEYKRHHVDTAIIATHFFAEPETLAPHRFDFFAYWTSKEALLKAQGAGLRSELIALEIAPPRTYFQPPRRSPAHLGLQHYQVSLCPAPQDYCCAVASTLVSPLLQVHCLHAEQLYRLLP